MKRRQREAVVATFDAKLAARGSWCGETHLQKSVFFLQEMLGVPTGFPFILYKFGPFSEELRTELGSMRADGFLELIPQPAPYGPKLHTTPIAQRQLIDRWPKTLRRYDAQLDFVAEQLAGMGVGALERLATALWVSHENPGGSEITHAERINELKPHVSVDLARDAVLRVAEMRREGTEILAAA